MIGKRSSEARTTARLQDGTDDDFAKAVARREDVRQISDRDRTPDDADAAAAEDLPDDETSAQPASETASASSSGQQQTGASAAQAEDPAAARSRAGSPTAANSENTPPSAAAQPLEQAIGAATLKPATALASAPQAAAARSNGGGLQLGATAEAVVALAEELAEGLSGEAVAANPQAEPATTVDPQATAKPDGGSAAAVTVLAGEAIRASRLGNATDSRATQPTPSANPAAPAGAPANVAAADHSSGGQTNGRAGLARRWRPVPRAQLDDHRDRRSRRHRLHDGRQEYRRHA